MFALNLKLAKRNDIEFQYNFFRRKIVVILKSYKIDAIKDFYIAQKILIFRYVVHFSPSYRKFDRFFYTTVLSCKTFVQIL